MKIKNAVKSEKNGWIRLSVKGEPYDIGYANGYLLSNELRDIFIMLDFVLLNDYGISRKIFSDIIYELYKTQIETNYNEYWKEIEGITAGAIAGGVNINIKDIILWNCYYSISYLVSKLPKLINENEILKTKYGEIFNDIKVMGANEGGGAEDRCTGLIAVGDYTKDGKILCCHNTFDNFIDSQYGNIILDIKPKHGSNIIMQTAPGCIASGTDYYISSNGFIVTETTIGGFNKFLLKDPICCRIRHAVQYSKKLDDFTEILQKNNGGDYANSWLIGDIKNNIIMRIELGLNYVNVEKKTNGYFIGFNAPYDSRIRNLECSNTGFYDIRRHQGARHVRLEQLVSQHKGKLDLKIGQEILADHYDVYLNKINMCSRTCCSHYNLDAREFMSQADRPKPFAPRGAMDGIVSTSVLAKKMELSVRWGSSCGTPFNVKEYCSRNIQWKEQEPYLKDRPEQEWTHFNAERKNKTKKKYKKPLEQKNKTKKKYKNPV